MNSLAGTLLALAATTALAPQARAQTPTMAKSGIGKSQVSGAMPKDGKEGGGKKGQLGAVNQMDAVKAGAAVKP